MNIESLITSKGFIYKVKNKSYQIYSGICVYCKNIFYTSDHPTGRGIYCSYRCSIITRNTGKFGKNHPAFKGTPKLDKDGYLRLHCPLRKRSVGVHRLVVEKSLGRFLNKNEHVHHKDHNKINNVLSNLVVMSASEYVSKHRIGSI